MSIELKKRILTSLILLTLFYIMYFYKFVLLIGLVIFSTIIWIEFVGLITKIIHFRKIKSYVIKFIYQFICLSYLLFFSTVFWYAFTFELNKIFYLFILGICIVTDIGGLVFGKFFKGKKLTKISPKKTVSGLIGSYVFTLTLMVIVTLTDYINYEHQLLVVTLIVSSASQIGDLFISYLKRIAKVKDTGDLLPGHGGFLDRFDGILFGFPFGFLIATFLNLT